MSEHEAKKPAEVLRTKRLEIVDHEGAVGERGPMFRVVLFITALGSGMPSPLRSNSFPPYSLPSWCWLPRRQY